MHQFWMAFFKASDRGTKALQRKIEEFWILSAPCSLVRRHLRETGDALSPIDIGF